MTSNNLDILDKEALFTVGVIIGAQGLKGELKVKPMSDFPERFIKPGKRWICCPNNGSPKLFELICGRKICGKPYFIIRLKGINDRNKAESLIKYNFLVPTNERPKLEKGEFHLLDLLGIKVRLEHQKEPIGKVTNLFSAGNDLLEIELHEGNRVLVPFVKTIVPEVNIKEAWLLLTPPGGLIDL